MSAENRKYGNLISEVKNSLYTHLKESLAEMFIKADETLLEMAESSKNTKDQNRYFELMHGTRRLNERISSDFIKSVIPYLRPFAITKAEKENREKELSLVDEDDVEKKVLIEGMGHNVAGQLSEVLSHLEARLEYLSLLTPDVFYKKALQPSNIIQAFDDALSNHFDIINKKTLFNFFNIHVALQLGNTYEAINNLLIDASILPQLKSNPNKSINGHANNHSRTETNKEPEQDINQGGYAMTAPLSRGTSQSTFTPSQGAASTSLGNSNAHPSDGIPASQIGEIVGNYLGGSPLAPTGSNNGASFFPAATGQHYGHEEILNALSNIQHSPAFSNAENAQYDGEAIKKAVLAEIAKTSGGVVTKSINRIAEKTIDFIELVFDAIIDDDNISDTIKTLLLRLQIPVIKASMIDQEFFIYDDHPARVLLDKIAHVGVGVTDRLDKIYNHLDKIVTTLVNEFELQAASFQTALDTLNILVEKQEAEALKKEEEEQKKVLREHARSTVLKSLRMATRGKVLPETIHALVLKRWPTMMYNHYLKQGKENDEWVNIVDTLRSIINSVQPLKNTNDLEHLVSTREHLIESTLTYLQRTNQSEEDIEQVIQYLIDIHQSLIDQADFDQSPDADETEDSTEEKTVSETTPVEAESDEDQQDEEAVEKLQLPSNMVPGMWFQVYTGEDKAQRRCKLSVVILDDQKLVFVNYHGEVIVEKDLPDFLNEIADGKSKVIMGHSVFDHALSSVVTNLQKKH